MNQGKLHIVIISTWMPTPGNTSGIFTLEQTDALAASGNKVSVMMFKYFSLFSWLKKILKREALSNYIKGRMVQPIAYNFVNPTPTRFSSDPLTAQKKAFLHFAEKKFLKYIQQFGKPDIIHHHEIADYCYLTAHLSKKYNIPYVITEHSPYDPDKSHFNPYETKEERLEMIRHASARIAVSTHYQKKYEQLFGSPFITIPNLVSNEFVQKPLPVFPKQNKPFTFLNVGSFSKIKRQDILIKTFAEAFKNNVNVHLTLVGNGPLEKELRDLISSTGMEKQVYLAGYKTKQELLQITDEAHVLVVSSETETFSVAAAEALTRGNPVLSTRCGGPEDFVNEQNGMLCNVNDVADMQEKMLAIYNKYASFDHKQIARNASDQFSEQAVVKKLEELYWITAHSH